MRGRRPPGGGEPMTKAAPVTRRALLSLRIGRGLATAQPGVTAQAEVLDPFESYETACALVNEARPFLAEEARRQGIATQNRSDLDILKEVFAKADLPSG